MMMRTLFFFIIIFVAIFPVKGQNFSIGFQVGYGTYILKDMKQFQSDVKNFDYRLNVKDVEQFPNNYYYSFQGNYFLNKRNLIGIKSSYHTTGGRNQIKDYSGEYKFDMLLNGYSIGIQYKNIVHAKNNIRASIRIAGGVNYTTLFLHELLNINGTEIFSESYNYESLGYFIEPSLGLSYHVYKGIYANVNLGYEIYFDTDLHAKEDNDLKLNNSDGAFGANWSGLRFSVGFSYEL